jgi:hypothetical protein
MNKNQKQLIDDLYNLLIEINEEGLKSDEFYNWLSQNYFFEEDLEEVIVRIKNAIAELD